MRDFAGMCLSVLCLIHCFGLPILAGTLLTQFFNNSGESFHIISVIFVALISVPILVQKGNNLTTTLALLGIATLAGALFVHTEALEQSLTAIGSISFIIAHLVRFKIRASHNTASA